MSKRKFSDLEIDVLAYLLKTGERRFFQIDEVLFPQHAKSFNQDENHFKVALVRTLDGLRENGYIEKKIKSPKNVCYNILEQKREEVEKIVRHYRNLKEIETLSDEEIEKLLKENKRLKRLNRIRELESQPLIGNILVSKIDELGLGINNYEFLMRSPNIIWMHRCPDDIPDIIVELTPEIKHPPIASPEDFERGWKLLGYVSSKKLYVYAIYKELLELYKEHLKETYTSLQNEYFLNGDEWKDLSPKICKMIENGSSAREIRGYLFDYISSLNDVDRLKKFFMKRGASLNKAEQWAREAIEEAKHAKIEN
jgi:DNA-binding PadR family transcriptional regulator